MITVETLDLNEKAAAHVAAHLPLCRKALAIGTPERISQREVSVWFEGGKVFLLVHETAGERDYGYRAGWAEMAGTKFEQSGAAQIASKATSDADAERIAKTGHASMMKNARKIESK